jgi:hypothetical protein
MLEPANRKGKKMHPSSKEITARHEERHQASDSSVKKPQDAMQSIAPRGTQKYMRGWGSFTWVG